MSRIYNLPEEDKQRIIELYKSGNSAITIRKLMGFSKRCRIVEKVLHQAEVEVLKGKRKIPLSKEPEIVGLYLGGMSSYKLSQEYGMVHSAICALLERNGVERRDNRVLTDEEERAAIEAYLSGKTMSEVGELFSIDTTTVPKIMKRHNAPTRPAGHNSRIYSLNEQAFDVIDNEQAAYWLGFIYADGSNSGEGFRVALSTRDEVQLIRLKAFLKTEAPIKHTQAKTPQGRMKPVCLLDVYSGHIADRLRDCGIIKGRNQFHKTLAHLPHDTYRHFIRGLVDGDGSLDTSKRNNARVRILGQEDILSWVVGVFSSELGLPSDKLIRQRLGICEVDYGGAKQARAIIRWLYGDATIWLERKLDKMKAWW